MSALQEGEGEPKIKILHWSGKWAKLIEGQAKDKTEPKTKGK